MKQKIKPFSHEGLYLCTVFLTENIVSETTKLFYPYY